MFSIIKKSQLEGANRLDAEYYQPEYLEYVKKNFVFLFIPDRNNCVAVMEDSSQMEPFFEEFHNLGGYYRSSYNLCLPLPIKGVMARKFQK